MEQLKSKILELVDQEYYYLKCKAAFKECFLHESNEEVRREIGIAFKSIQLLDDYINISFNSPLSEEFIIEVRINLLNLKNGKSLGYYKYQEDMDGEYLDEYLIFDGLSDV